MNIIGAFLFYAKAHIKRQHPFLSQYPIIYSKQLNNFIV